MRTIDKIIIHCSATPEGRPHSVEDIRRWHKAQGFADVGYHYVIGLDGAVFRGRPLEQDRLSPLHEGERLHARAPERAR